MTERDTWARITPYEIGIPGREFAEENFRAMAEEAEGRGVDPSDPGAFVLLGEVGRVLSEIRGEEERGGEAVHRFSAFLFHAFHFHRAGEPLFLLGTATARYLVEGAPEPEGWEGELPAPAGYLQLPRHLFWARPGEAEEPGFQAAAGEEGSPGAQGAPGRTRTPDTAPPPTEGTGQDGGPAEPVDGIFWARAAGDSLSLLVAMGIRPDRTGLSVVDLPPLPLSDAPAWITDPAREEGEDFATTLPGGELDRLYSLETLGEALKLAARALGYLATVPGAVGEEERAPHPNELPEDHGGPLPSLLPFRRVRLVGEGG